MKLQIKIILTVLSIFIISFLLVGFLIFTNSEKIIRAQIQNQLVSLSASTEKSINVLVDEQKNKIELIATQSALSNEELDQMILLDDSIYEIFVLDSNGIIIASSNITNLGGDKSQDSYFIDGKNKTSIKPAYLSPSTNRYSIAISTPFHEGVLVMRTDLAYFNRITDDRTGLGKTEENLMAFKDSDGNAVYFSNRLFSNNNFEIISGANIPLPMQSALNNETTFFINAKDYRGVEVIAVSDYIGSIGVGLVTKIDKTEAVMQFANAGKKLLLPAIGETIEI